MEIENLKFRRLIVHEAMKRTPENEEVDPEQSDEIFSLESAGDKEVRRRVSDAFGRSSHCVGLDIEESAEGSTFELSCRLLDADDGEFVGVSQRIARTLSKAQSGSGSARSGLAVIIEGTMTHEGREKRLILIIKADSESAFAKERTGKRVTLRLIKDLFLGPQQKLYKIGAFIENNAGEAPRDATDFSAIVFDHLMSQSGDRDAAAYFYRGFLGCRLSASAIRQTRQFFELTSAFIDKIPKLGKGDKIDLKNSLKVYLKNQKPQFSVADFADEFLRQELHADYKKFMKTEKFPASAVTKDTAAIKSKLRLQNVVFSSEVKISAPAEKFKELVKIGKVQDGWTAIQIRGTVETE